MLMNHLPILRGIIVICVILFYNTKNQSVKAQNLPKNISHVFSNVASIQQSTIAAEKGMMNCPTPPIYRTYDGSCNNVNVPSYGMSGTALLREVAAEYGSNDPNNELNSRLGSNPRNISNYMSSQSVYMPSSHQLSSFVFTWGQFTSRNRHFNRLSGADQRDYRLD